MSQPSLSIPIIGYHRSALTQKFGIPRQPNLVQLPSVIELIAPYDSADAFAGIERFSHLWITWYTHHNYLNKTAQTDNDQIDKQTDTGLASFKPKVRPPRLGGNTKLGVFATRSTYRPSQLGLSVVKLIEVEKVGESVRLQISGADMVDGTPIIDIKPYIAYSDAVPDAVSGFAAERPQLKSVLFSEAAAVQFSEAIALPEGGMTAVDRDIICQLIAQDPRPAYRQQQSDRVFYMRYKNYDIGFQSQPSADTDRERELSSALKQPVVDDLIIVSLNEIS